MKPGANIVALAAARLYGPLTILFALSLLATGAPGAGVGFVAGLAGALALLTHVLVFGAEAARQAAPPLFARLVLSLGLIAVAAGAGAPHLAWSAQVLEAGLFAVTVGAASLVLATVIGRAPTLRDEAA